ncbi:four-helix bundle copper-binding protein [Persicitalea sp.]|uniref:four-helix bundle copper-binding protein n=1 Tax=Persicitalea sp. TaxID=3100273 RepID=UPI003593BEFB
MTKQQMEDCIKACQECAVACGNCIDGCLSEDNVKMMAQCIRTDIDCMNICHSTVQFMSLGSPYAKQACELCATICEACAEECEKHADMHDHCRKCAEACRKCAKACREMAAA